MKILISYDIPNDKKRNKIAHILEAYGYRVNYSVFECEINQTKFKKLKAELLTLLNPKTDNIRFYFLCQKCIEKSFILHPNKDKNVFTPDNDLFF
ncbi:TPA: CRISPR-associated endonuclease Cas2 [Campylobacter lari]|uniref:CRISPR-associated endoribonuclease Cas2 n=1 Tax=Campylobacter lari TaxID=201 RepID=A0A698FVG4_CAMLA|nr:MULTISPECIES: CRISPR-associated endonuclease Cas2 [Campylobacter]ECW8954156.1 CRISPR-associated endonuclease Cas2 [Campylobacter lari]MBT0793731.1 CRISPR-associated endonuclease Cas2 [Campylobacter lari]MCR6510395.1 CRISPR-associated endonuclease Cas2 [Campylobacter lari]MCR6527543.1 CRISPR-associated endonuclease Cas2 [Campylobacter lari]MCR6557033.1 CRISPR-associated endonuclease Cas2 [Campylobacter lari]